MLISFAVGFALVGGVMSIWLYSEFSDVHQQSYEPAAILPNILQALACIALPAGLFSVLLTGIIRWSIRQNWWRSGKPGT
jgi:hypothetical protein